MRGLIYGDVCGSAYEWKPVEEHKNITEPMRFTDDTVLGAAVADALITCREQGVEDDAGILDLLTQKLQSYGRRYPDAGYSRTFRAWLASDDPKPYGSKTNGAIMRCTSAGWLAGSAQEAGRLGRLSAMPTHNHPEAMDAAALAAEVVYRLRMGESAEAMHALLAQCYDIPRLDDIRPITEFDFTSKTTLPIAFAAFYEAVEKYGAAGEDCGAAVVIGAVKDAIFLGGDTDTNAAVAAAFAEAWDAGRSADLPCAQRKPWYDGIWEETARLCTPDILDVVRRLDEAVAKTKLLQE